jgi:hypothetical protein
MTGTRFKLLGVEKLLGADEFDSLAVGLIRSDFVAKTSLWLTDAPCR